MGDIKSSEAIDFLALWRPDDRDVNPLAGAPAWEHARRTPVDNKAPCRYNVQHRVSYEGLVCQGTEAVCLREERLLSVGIDIGTSTTQCVFSALTLSDTASSFSVPRVSITRKEVIWRAPVRLTPLADADTIDAQALEAM